jgi:hypothetical protein
MPRFTHELDILVVVADARGQENLMLRPMTILRWMLAVGLLGSMACKRKPSSPFCPQGMDEVPARSEAGKSVWCEARDKSSAQWRAQWIEWHVGTTKPRQSCAFHDGKPEGSFTAWHPDGKLWVQGQFATGAKVGKWKQWDAEGNEVAEGDYQGGRLVAGAPVAGMALCEKMVRR